MKRLILTGEIGSGKTTLIRNALGENVYRAGGFVTGRVWENGILQGYALTPAAALAASDIRGQLFLTLSPTPVRNDAIFTKLGVPLLKAALQAPFAIADEFGGLELLIAPFYAQLLELLRSDIPLIGVIKTPRSIRALAEKIPLGEDYAAKAQALYTLLEKDPETLILPVRGWDDPIAAETVRIWVNTHVRR